MTAPTELLRPIIGIENRTAQEVFDIMCDRFRALPVGDDGLPPDLGAGDVLAIHDSLPETPLEAYALGWNECRAVFLSAQGTQPQAGEAVRWENRLSPENITRIVSAPQIANPAQVTDALKSAEKALRPFYDAVFNDNGDMTVDGPHDYDEAVAGYFAYKKIRRAIGAGGQAVAPDTSSARLREIDLVKDRFAYPTGPLAEGRDIYRVIGFEGSDRGGLLLSAVEAEAIVSAFRRSTSPTHPAPSGQAVAADIGDAVLAWMVKYDLLDGDNEYQVADVMAVMDDLAPSSALSQPHPAVEALERMVALYESEHDADVPFVRPDWLVAALSAKEGRQDG